MPESPQAENYITDALPPEQLQLINVTDYPDIICRAEFSPDGRYLAAMAGTAPHVLDAGTGKIIWKHLATREEYGTDLSWAPDSRRIAVSTAAGPGVFDGVTGRTIWRNEPPPDGHYKTIAWSPADDLIAVGSPSGSVTILDAANGSVVRTLSHHRGSVIELAWSPDGQFLVSGGGDGDGGGKEPDHDIRVWDTKTGSVVATLEGHTGYVADLAWSPRSATLISASQDSTIRVWDPLNGRLTHTIEVHTRETQGIAFSPDGQIFASSSGDDTMRFWRTADLRQLGTVRFNDNGHQVYDRVAFSPDGRMLCATRTNSIFLFRVNVPALAAGSAGPESVQYTTAKLVLVGDAGVGKTGLGWRLSHSEFREHASTHGQQFWVVETLGTTRPDGTECEAVLWDLAGQHVYRPVHVIFLEKVDVALLVF